MRAFIGIEFSSELKKNIINIQNVIKSSSIKGRWKYIDNFHVTLKFLGEASIPQIDDIYSEVSDKLNDFKAFNIQTEGIGCFKGINDFRVIYLKLADRDLYLKTLSQIAEDASCISGFPREKRAFTPHITLAQDVTLKEDFSELANKVSAISEFKIPVKRISIIKSEQIGNSRIYTPICSIDMAGPKGNN